METLIKKILEDIYLVDPSFKQNEKELSEIVKALLQNRPNTNFDEKFKAQLKKEILEKARDVLIKKSVSSTICENFNYMKKFYYAFGGAFAMLVLISASTAYYLSKTSTVANRDYKKNRVPSSVIISTAGERAFGAIKTDVPLSAADGRGAGGVWTFSTAQNAPQSEAAVGMPNPFSIKYKYVYKGEELNLKDEKQEVLKRIKKVQSPSNLADLIKQNNSELINLNAFEKLNVQNISLLEDKDYGHFININLSEGTISISENWEKWNQEIARCRDEKCLNQNRLTISDVPDDNSLIAMADNFIAQMGIDTAAYGEPQINNQWRDSYEKTLSKKNYYIPETISITYPLRIKNSFVYEEVGEKFGLRVTINIRHKRASGLWNLSTQNYESSLYEAETDADKILEIAENGGFRNYPYNNIKAEIRELEIGEPTRAYVKIWQYKAGKNEELLVPCLTFSVKNPPEDTKYFYKRNIIVPLVKELLDNDESSVPLIEPAIDN